MTCEIRQASRSDMGQLAYLILVWDSELPVWLRMINGDEQAALKSAQLMLTPQFVTYVVCDGADIVGVLTIHTNTSLFGLHPYGSVSGVFVLPKYRGGRLLGLRLIRQAMELKHTHNWTWLEFNPWADDINTKRVLARLGFDEATHTHVLR